MLRNNVEVYRKLWRSVEKCRWGEEWDSNKSAGKAKKLIAVKWSSVKMLRQSGAEMCSGSAKNGSDKEKRYIETEKHGIEEKMK